MQSQKTLPQRQSEEHGPMPSQRAKRLSVPREIALPWLPSKRSAVVVLMSSLLASCSVSTVPAPGPEASAKDPRIDAPPAPVLADTEDPCEYGVDGCDAGYGDICMVRPTWNAIGDYMDAWLDYPDLCRLALDEQNGVWRVIIRGAYQVGAARLAQHQIDQVLEEQKAWPRWQVAILAAVAAAVGVAGGMIAGLALAMQE